MQYYAKKTVNTVNLFRVHDRQMFLNSHSLVKMQSSTTQRFLLKLSPLDYCLLLLMRDEFCLIPHFSIWIYFLFCLFLLLCYPPLIFAIHHFSIFLILSSHNVFAFPSSFDSCVIFPQLLLVWDGAFQLWQQLTLIHPCHHTVI